MINRLLIVAVGVAAVLIFFIFDFGQYLDLEYLKASQQKFQSLYRNNRIVIIGVYFLIYLAVTALSLPGAAVMTLAGGAMFGFWIALILVSFASTIGATVACAVSRFLLRDWVQSRFGDKLQAVNEGIEKDGAFYLFTLRLVPIFPFFVINLVMGMTKISLWTYTWVSQVGMLAATAVYVNAGKELSKIDSPGDVLSLGLVISFIILGLFPLSVKKLLDFYQRKFRTDEVGRSSDG